MAVAFSFKALVSLELYCSFPPCLYVSDMLLTLVSTRSDIAEKRYTVEEALSLILGSDFEEESESSSESDDEHKRLL